MINDIIDGIAGALSKVKTPSGAECTIYKESIPQGFKEPCFSIVHIMGENVPYLTGRYLKKNRFDIHYFPTPCNPEKREKEEMYAVENKLHFALEYIKVSDKNKLDNLFRGTKMSSEIVDGVLHFFVSYDRFVGVQEPELPHMETLTMEE